MNKVFGLISEFAPVRTEGTRIVISYGFEAVDNEKATWIEVYLPKKQHSTISFEDVKKAIIADIDAQTDEKILCGFEWEDDNGDNIKVWLSAENQRNFSEAQRLADKKGEENYTPKKFKIGEVEGSAKYRTFATLDELNNFYYAVCDYIEACLGAGWIRKDTINFTPYQAAFPVPENNESADAVEE